MRWCVVDLLVGSSAITTTEKGAISSVCHLSPLHPLALTPSPIKSNADVRNSDDGAHIKGRLLPPFCRGAGTLCTGHVGKLAAACRLQGKQG